MPSTTPEETMSVHLTQPCRSISPGLERELRNTDARATIAERRARVTGLAYLTIAKPHRRVGSG